MLFLPADSDPNPLLKWSYVTGQWDQIQAALVTHIELTIFAVGLGLVLSALLSALVLKYDWAHGPITGFTGFLYTIPSVAVFGLLSPYTGFSKLTALIALVGYSLLILVTNIVAGFRAVPRAVLDAADGMGMSPAKRRISVELPLALPYIFTGLRIGIGLSWLAIVAAEMLIGGVGIGFFIWDAWNSSRLPDIIVALVYIGIVGFLLDKLIATVGHFVSHGVSAQ